MSWLAEKNATVAARPAIVHRSSFGSSNPNSGIEISSATCVSSIQPRRRPSSGNAYRSSKGDHRNFHVNGSCISANNPIEVRSTCSERSHAGRRLISSQSGRPELNPVKTQISIRRLNSASERRFFGRVIARIVTVRLRYEQRARLPLSAAKSINRQYAKQVGEHFHALRIAQHDAFENMKAALVTEF